MHDNKTDSYKCDEQDGSQRESSIARTTYLRENFWPLCGMAGGMFLFFAAAAVVPP